MSSADLWPTSDPSKAAPVVTEATPTHPTLSQPPIQLELLCSLSRQIRSGLKFSQWQVSHWQETWYEPWAQIWQTLTHPNTTSDPSVFHCTSPLHHSCTITTFILFPNTPLFAQADSYTKHTKQMWMCISKISSCAYILSHTPTVILQLAFCRGLWALVYSTVPVWISAEPCETATALEFGLSLS